MIKLSTITNIFLHVLFLTISIYVFQDLINSKNVNLIGGDRLIVHILLVIIIILLLGYNLLYGLSFYFYIDAIQFSLIGLNIWIFMISILRGAPIQYLLVHFGLSFLWVLSYSFASSFFSNKLNNTEYFYNWILIILCMYIVGMLYAQYSIKSIDGRIPVLNLIYFVMSFIPWINLIGTRKKITFLNSVILVLVLISLKRGAIIIYTLMVLSYFLVKNFKDTKKLNTLLKIGLFFSIFVAAIFFVNYLTDGFLLHRFSSNELFSGSGRNILYERAITHIKERSIFDKLVGFGSGSSIALLGNGVHNEWLEFLFSYGIIGALLYLNFVLAILIKTFKLIRAKSDISPVLTQAAVLVTVIGLFDGFYFMHSTLYIMLFFGTISGKERKIKIEGLNNEYK